MARTQSGSVAPYVWGLVIFGVAMVVFLILWIVANNEIKANVDALAEYRAETQPFVDEDDRDNEQVLEAKAIADEEEKYDSAVQVLVDTNAAKDERIRVLTGMVDEQQESAGFWEDEAGKFEDQVESLTTRLNEQEQSTRELSARYDQMKADFERRMTEAVAAGVPEDYAEKLAATEAAAKQAVEEKLEPLKADLTAKEQEVIELQTELARLQNELDTITTRVQRRIDLPALTEADARITAVNLEDREIELDLDEDDRVLRGMTFEVFPDGELVKVIGYDNLRGLATVEVTTLMENRSKARIIRLEPGARDIRVGDKLVNIAFDNDRTYRFFVYGLFDINSDGSPSIRDTDLMEDLIEKWGGKVVEEFDWNIDYLVLGLEPDAPEDVDEFGLDPIEIERRREQRQIYDRYQELIEQAARLNIPVLNQYRALALLGYYEIPVLRAAR